MGPVGDEFSDVERARLASLRDYGILDTPPEAAFDRIAALAAELFETPIAAISLIDEDRQWFKAILGLDATETSREVAFCAHTILTDDVFEVSDAEHDARFSDNPLVTNDPSIRFYAGAPLTLRNGLRMGALCVIDRAPRAGLTERERRRLATLAQIVVNEMDLRLMNERYALVARKAEAATAAKSEFLANMTHELRTPLASVIGFTSFLAATPDLGDRERNLAVKAKSASEKLLTIVNDVLDLASLEAGAAFAVEPVDIGPVVTSAVDLFTERADEKHLTLSVDLPPGLPPAPGDPARLRQVLVNLLGNAVKFTEAGGVTVTARQVQDEIWIDVADTGVGIPTDKLGLIFERFEQGGAEVARRFGGTGLGLAISKRLAEQMGGSIAVASQPGTGSTFTVRLPTFSTPSQV
jgi:signal transduction histidine kinase